MSKELVINSDSQTTRIAIVEGGELAELFIETEEHERTIGNLFLGRVRRIMPSIQAAFVDIGQKQDAFLHFSDLTEALPDWLEYSRLEKPEIAAFEPGHVHKARAGRRRRPISGGRRKRLEDGAEDPEAELAEEQGDGEHRRVVGSRNRHKRKAGQRRDVRRGEKGGDHHHGDEDGVPPETFLKRDQPILVKISKEPIAQKGSRVTTDISLAGRFCVLVPMANYVAVSKKVSSFKERRRLRALAKMLLPDGFGVIVRTVAEGQNAKALDTDLRLLREKWQAIERRLAERPKPPAAVYQDVNMVSSIMRDLFSEDFDRILVDNNRTYRNIKGYVQAIAPEMGAKVHLHQGRSPVFHSVGIHRAVAEAFESRVNLPSGGYLFIEQTEAMHVVDVNSGRAGKGLSQEDNSLKVNIEAAKVIARQIRLRDLGGILVIDFIDMRSERNRRKVYDQLRREFRRDRAVTKVLPMSDFGLMQITRQRLRPSITTTFSDLQEEIDDAVESAVEVVRDGREPMRERPRAVEPREVVKRIEDWMEAFKIARWKGAVRLRVHPFTAAYLSRGLLGFAARTLLRYRMRVKLEGHPGMDPGRFRFYDETNGKEIRRPPRRGRKKPAEKQEKPAADEEVRETPKDRRAAGRRDDRGRTSDARGRDDDLGKPASEEKPAVGRRQRPERRSKDKTESADSGRNKGAKDQRGRRTEAGSRSGGSAPGKSPTQKPASAEADASPKSKSETREASEKRSRGNRGGRGRRKGSAPEAAVTADTAHDTLAIGESAPDRMKPAASVRDVAMEPEATAPEAMVETATEPDVVETKPKRRATRAKSNPRAKKPKKAEGSADPDEQGSADAPLAVPTEVSSTERDEEGANEPAQAPVMEPAGVVSAEAADAVTVAEVLAPEAVAQTAPAGEPAEAAPKGEPATVRKETKKVQPFQLRYSSGHRTQQTSSDSDQE